MKKIIGLSLLLILTGALHDIRSVQGAAPDTEVSAEPWAMVLDVADGNVLMLSNGESVRLAGIAVPGSATDAMGKDAAGYIRQLVAGQPVRLEYASQPKEESGQDLAYVFVVTDKLAQAKVNWPDDYVIMTSREFQEIFLNATLLRRGFARIPDGSPDGKYRDLFEKLQAGARENRRGVWETSGKN